MNQPIPTIKEIVLFALFPDLYGYDKKRKVEKALAIIYSRY